LISTTFVAVLRVTVTAAVCSGAGIALGVAGCGSSSETPTSDAGTAGPDGGGDSATVLPACTHDLAQLGDVVVMNGDDAGAPAFVAGTGAIADGTYVLVYARGSYTASTPVKELPRWTLRITGDRAESIETPSSGEPVRRAWTFRRSGENLSADPACGPPSPLHGGYPWEDISGLLYSDGEYLDFRTNAPAVSESFILKRR